MQESAGIFTYVKDHIMSVAGSTALTTDLFPETLNAFRSMLVAQAQECFYDKASSDPSCKYKAGISQKLKLFSNYVGTKN